MHTQQWFSLKYRHEHIHIHLSLYTSFCPSAAKLNEQALTYISQTRFNNSMSKMLFFKISYNKDIYKLVNSLALLFIIHCHLRTSKKPRNLAKFSDFWLWVSYMVKSGEYSMNQMCILSSRRKFYPCLLALVVCSAAQVLYFLTIIWLRCLIHY